MKTNKCKCGGSAHVVLKVGLRDVEQPEGAESSIAACLPCAANALKSLRYELLGMWSEHDEYPFKGSEGDWK